MSAAVEEILRSFDELPEPEKHQATVEILRRYSAQGDLPEGTLVGLADELFHAMDQEESCNAQS